jgi:membrane protein
MKRLWGLIKPTYEQWAAHNAPKMGASLAYYTVLSLAPILIVVVSVIGFVLGPKAAEGQVVGQIQQMVGNNGAQAIQTVLAHANHPASGIISSIIGLITLFIGASGVFSELRDSLNTIWDVPATNTSSFTNSGLLTTARKRALSFGMVLAIGFLLLVSLVISTALAAAGKYAGQILPISAGLLELMNFFVSVLVITVLFALIFKFLPDVHVSWRDVWIGAFATSVLFTVGKILLGLYIGWASVGSVYGAAGSLVVVLVWVYYSAQIFLFGAEFTHVYSKQEAREPKAVS